MLRSPATLIIVSESGLALCTTTPIAPTICAVRTAWSDALRDEILDSANVFFAEREKAAESEEL